RRQCEFERVIVQDRLDQRPESDPVAGREVARLERREARARHGFVAGREIARERRLRTIGARDELAARHVLELRRYGVDRDRDEWLRLLLDPPVAGEGTAAPLLRL